MSRTVSMMQGTQGMREHQRKNEEKITIARGTRVEVAHQVLDVSGRSSPSTLLDVEER